MLCKNARIHKDIHIAQVLAEVGDVHWDVVCFAETRAPDEDCILEGGHRLICSRKEFICAGVAILLHKRWLSSVIGYKRVSDRLLFLDLAVGHRKYRIISVYFPHAGCSLEFFESCYDGLRKVVLDAHSKCAKCMIGGDFNADLYQGWRG